MDKMMVVIAGQSTKKMDHRIRFGGHGDWRWSVGVCRRTWRRVGTDGAVATADPCVNRALGVFLYD